MSNEEKLKEAFLTLLSANAYIAANNVTGIIAWDASHDKELDQFAVDLDGYKNSIPGTPFITATVVITAGTVAKQDKDRSKIKAIYEALKNQLKLISKVDLSAVSGLTIDAIHSYSGGDANIQNDMHIDAIQCVVELTE
jgi:hypothetical protein